MPRFNKSATTPASMGVVETLAERVIELHAQPLVDYVERLEGGLPELFPELATFRVAGLKQNQFALGCLANALIRFGFVLNLPVKRFEMTERIELQFLRIALAFIAEQDHAEAGAPIAKMIIGDDGVAEKTINPRQGVAENRAAQMTDMHFLGDVRTAVIDDHGFRRSHGGNAETVVTPPPADLPGQVFGLEPEIEKSRGPRYPVSQPRPSGR